MGNDILGKHAINIIRNRRKAYFFSYAARFFSFLGPLGNRVGERVSQSRYLRDALRALHDKRVLCLCTLQLDILGGSYYRRRRNWIILKAFSCHFIFLLWLPVACCDFSPLRGATCFCQSGVREAFQVRRQRDGHFAEVSSLAPGKLTPTRIFHVYNCPIRSDLSHCC